MSRPSEILTGTGRDADFDRQVRLETLQRAGLWTPGYGEPPSPDVWWVAMLWHLSALALWLLPGIGLCLAVQWVMRQGGWR